MLKRNPFHLYDSNGTDCGVNGVFIGQIFIAAGCIIIFVCYVVFLHNVVSRYVRQGLLARKRSSQRAQLDIELGQNTSSFGNAAQGSVSSRHSTPAPPYECEAQPPPGYDYNGNNTFNTYHIAGPATTPGQPRSGFDLERRRLFHDSPRMISWTEWLKKREQRIRQVPPAPINDSYLMARPQLPARALVGGDLDRYEIARTDRMRSEGLCPPVAVAYPPNYSYWV
ncbi:hypothetical protein CDD82_6684 [Ophiocordyceps australis]|uniref:Uncharacterized protein n=1 Tax=Ophiocordyceps australis TaxID=1399860 RepID=A0A2C5YTW6_9HYPO|nr:hypothetical protein CDD82_6684 [Ophiocordyceps australis]